MVGRRHATMPSGRGESAHNYDGQEEKARTQTIMCCSVGDQVNLRVCHMQTFFAHDCAFALGLPLLRWSTRPRFVFSLNEPTR